MSSASFSARVNDLHQQMWLLVQWCEWSGRMNLWNSCRIRPAEGKPCIDSSKSPLTSRGRVNVAGVEWMQKTVERGCSQFHEGHGWHYIGQCDEATESSPGDIYTSNNSLMECRRSGQHWRYAFSRGDGSIDIDQTEENQVHFSEEKKISVRC